MPATGSKGPVQALGFRVDHLRVCGLRGWRFWADVSHSRKLRGRECKNSVGFCGASFFCSFYCLIWGLRFIVQGLGFRLLPFRYRLQG